MDREKLFISMIPDNGFDGPGIDAYRKGFDDALDGKPMDKRYECNAYINGYKDTLKIIAENNE